MTTTTNLEPMTLVHRVVPSPIGALTLFASDRALVGLYFEQHRPAPRSASSRTGASAILDRAEAELDRYFTTREHRFDVALSLDGTELERAVWSSLTRIPTGETRAYGEIALRLDRPSAARAIGAAIARNPISIIVPCHRVIAKSGLLTGYAGGIERKAWLLAHERAAIATAGSRSHR
jgi:methylated-DNA-[protein]-cysteine S-methyltransferase